uniref:RRM domain-containing protein n=1 Tax=Chenopodium quinoa TaxID=63459 RepID=A0A803L2G1_CHEQI
MSDQYWRYTDSRQPPAVSSLPAKRPRSDYDVPSGRDVAGYYSRDDDRLAHRAIRDTESINQSYDRYLRSTQLYPGADSGRLPSSGISSHAVDDPRLGNDPRHGNDPRLGNDPRMSGDPRMVSDPRMVTDPRINSDPRMTGIGIMDPAMSLKGRGSNLGSGRSEVSLPPDASSTLYVEGLPANYIFRPFVGYKEVRLVTKEARHSGGDPLVLCFVDFLSPAHAATALDALQGYKFDENDRDTSILRLQFARYPGARSGGGHRGKR